MSLVASHASVDPQVYFKSMSPNTPIPKAIKDSLSIGIFTHLNKGSIPYVVGKPKENFPAYSDAASDEQIMGLQTTVLFFLEKDMYAGKNVNLHIGKGTTTTRPFVPRQVADSLPLTSNKIQDIYSASKVNPDSIEATLTKKTINECKKASNQKEDKYCATSLESMVDFAASKFGERVKAVSTQVDGNESALLQGYKVEMQGN